MYTTTPLGLCVKPVQEVNRSPVHRRYRLLSRYSASIAQNGSNCKMSEELATEVNQALRDKGDEYRWVLVEGGE
jgi:hypothetical protein